jgi:DnaJ-class molecular chaperone
MEEDDDVDLARIFAWAELLEDSNYYELLGVLEIADESAIKRAFHDFALGFHPDSQPALDADADACVRRVFERGAEAYRVLSHSDMRARYDLALARGQLRLGASEIPVRAAIGGAKSLDDLCRSAAARLHAQRASELISRGDLTAAKRELMLAIREDGGNPELAERLDALDLALFAMGS